MVTDMYELDIPARLKRLDAAAGAAPNVGYDYGTLIDRHAGRQRRRRRRQAIARGTATALVVSMLGLSLWRFEQQTVAVPPSETEPTPVADAQANQPRIVRADTYLAVAALEDHIASIDEALNDARLGGGTAEVARLERTRAMLVDSYASVRYAEMVSANF
jgi:hypothetical protein